MQTALEGANLWSKATPAGPRSPSCYSLKEVRLSQPVRTDLSEVIAENFGANATYVEGLLSRFRSNPELVDESWRAYFAELLGDGDGSGTASAEQREVRVAENGGGAPARTTTAEAAAPAKAEAPAAPPKRQPSQPNQPTPYPFVALHSKSSRTWKRVCRFRPPLRSDAFP